MFLISRPTRSQIDEFLRHRESDVFSYAEVGRTYEPPFPDRYNLDHNRIQLGNGLDDFERAKSAIRAWVMFKVPGVELIPSDTPIETGRNVAMVAHHMGFHSLNSCRIVYTIDEPDRFGFAYGTLTEHVEVGEERFTVEFHDATGDVWYDILAFSRPGNPFVKLGYPYARHLQKKFAVNSKKAMVKAVQTR
jgi:uncharacterized protein (UPF0548 family)